MDGRHGRIETRRALTILFLQSTELLDSDARGEDLETSGMVEAEPVGGWIGKSGDILLHLPAVRQEAVRARSTHSVGLESCILWAPDIAFQEDDGRVRKRARPENLATFRRSGPTDPETRGRVQACRLCSIS